MSKSLLSPSARDSRARLLAAGVAGALLLWPGIGMSAPGGAFAAFEGSWRGGGQVTTGDGHRERITCKATYELSDSGESLTQTLVCASDSYKFDVQCYVEASGGVVKGHWEETTRSVSGNLTGRVSNGDFEGAVMGTGFTAQISLKTTGGKQAVNIRPQGSEITDVEVALLRQR